MLTEEQKRRLGEQYEDREQLRRAYSDLNLQRARAFSAAVKRQTGE